MEHGRPGPGSWLARPAALAVMAVAWAVRGAWPAPGLDTAGVPAAAHSLAALLLAAATLVVPAPHRFRRSAKIAGQASTDTLTRGFGQHATRHVLFSWPALGFLLQHDPTGAFRRGIDCGPALQEKAWLCLVSEGDGTAVMRLDCGG